MKNKHPNAIVVLALGFAMAGCTWPTCCSGPTPKPALPRRARSGCGTSPGWRRWCCPTCPPAARQNQPTGLQVDTCPPLGLCMVLAGAALVTSGVAMGPVAKYAVQYRKCSPPTTRPGRPGPIYCCRFCAAHGCCITAAGRSRVLECSGKAGQSAVCRHGAALFLWKLIYGSSSRPRRSYRMPCALRVLSAAAALLFAVVLIKVFLCAGAALRPHAVRGGHRGISALHRAGTDPDPV